MLIGVPATVSSTMFTWRTVLAVAEEKEVDTYMYTYIQ